MGLIVPTGMILLAGGVPTKLDEGSLRIGSSVGVALVVAGVGWIMVGLATRDTQRKRLCHCAITGFQPPAIPTRGLATVRRYSRTGARLNSGSVRNRSGCGVGRGRPVIGCS